MTNPTPYTPPRVVALRVRNYRALRDVNLKDLTPLTVLLGPFLHPLLPEAVPAAGQ